MVLWHKIVVLVCFIGFGVPNWVLAGTGSEVTVCSDTSDIWDDYDEGAEGEVALCDTMDVSSMGGMGFTDIVKDFADGAWGMAGLVLGVLFIVALPLLFVILIMVLLIRRKKVPTERVMDGGCEGGRRVHKAEEMKDSAIILAATGLGLCLFSWIMDSRIVMAAGILVICIAGGKYLVARRKEDNKY